MTRAFYHLTSHWSNVDATANPAAHGFHAVEAFTVRYADAGIRTVSGWWSSEALSCFDDLTLSSRDGRFRFWDPAPR